MYHNFLTHSSADGHLGCFHVLAVENSAAVDTGVPVSFLILVSSGYISQKKKDKYHILTYIYGVKKDGTNDPTCRAAKETQT